MKTLLDRLERRGTAAARLCAVFGMLALVVFLLMTNVDVLMRWLFNSPVNGVSDVGPLVVAVVTAAFFPFVLAERHHVSIGFLGGLLGPRAQLWLEALAALVTWVFFALLAWQIVLYAVELHQQGQTTWVVQWPVAPWWAVVGFFFAVCVVVQVGVVVTELSAAIHRRNGEEERPARSGDASG